jgi:hypothetical protein
MTNFISFKRFVTFGLGLGMFMSASSGFAQTVIPSNIVKATNGNLLLQGTNSSGVPTQSVSISNVGHISARSADFNGTDGVAAQKVTLSNGGTISGTAQVVTIDAVGNGNIKLMDSTQVQGNITATGTISTSQVIQTTGTGSINSAYSLTAAGNKFRVAGDTGNVSTNGTLSAASGSFEVTSTGLTKANQGLAVNGGPGLTVGSTFKVDPNGTVNVGNGKIGLNSTNGNVFTTGVFNAGGKAMMDAATGNITSLGTTDTNKLIVRNGAQITNGGLDMTNAKITRVATGTADSDAANVGQLNNTVANAKTEAIDAAAADATTKANAVQANLNSEITTRTSEVARVDGRIDATNTNVTNLTTAVNTNATTAATATAQVQTNLDTEVTRAKAAEADLDSRKADKTALTAETAARIEGDKQLGNRIDATNTSVTTEVIRLDGRIDSTDSALAQTNQAFANEVVERKAQDAEHTTSIQRNANAIAAESTRAQQAEAAISKEVRQVGAMAMAAAAVGAATPVGDKKTAVSVAVGGYSGEAAVAIGVTHMVKPTTRIFGSISSVSRGKTGVAVGASFSF